MLSGQKIWTSHGATARRLVCLVRTGSLESRHRGLTMVTVDTDTPGVEIRPIAMASGQNELFIVAGRKLRELRDAVDELPDGGVRRLGECYTDIATLKARSANTVRRLAAGDTVGPEASVDKILPATVETGLHDAARDLLPGEFLFGEGPLAARWRDDWWYSRASTIMGGSAEVQRGIIADRVMNLPNERTT